eukprot:490603_1
MKVEITEVNKMKNEYNADEKSELQELYTHLQQEIESERHIADQKQQAIHNEHVQQLCRFQVEYNEKLLKIKEEYEQNKFRINAIATKRINDCDTTINQYKIDLRDAETKYNNELNSIVQKINILVKNNIEHNKSMNRILIKQQQQHNDLHQKLKQQREVKKKKKKG